MKFALVNGEKVEATKGAKGTCRLCGSEVGAYCGKKYAHHWKHRGERKCDTWWEPETEWHLAWKDKFPKDWQEVIHTDDETGEKHIADVKTDDGWTIEFQHSPIKPEERDARNAFYPKLVWIVDGLRRKRDIKQFQKVLNDSSVLVKEFGIRHVSDPEECTLLDEWCDSRSLVFFDFHGLEATEQSQMWFLFPKLSTTGTYVAPFSWAKFIEMHNENKFDKFFNDVILPYCKNFAIYEQKKRRNIAHSRQRIVRTRVVPRHKNRRF